MKHTTILILSAALFASCAYNPGNIGPVVQKRAIQQSQPVLINGKDVMDATHTCNDLDLAVQTVYLDMQPEPVSAGKQVVNGVLGFGYIFAGHRIAAEIPQARKIDSIVNAKARKQGTINMLAEQMGQSMKLQSLHRARQAKNCTGNIIDLFVEKK